MTSQPTSRKPEWICLMTSGRDSTSSSLQPSLPQKSSASRPADCTLVPIAPSKTTTRCAMVCKRSGIGRSWYRYPRRPMHLETLVCAVRGHVVVDGRCQRCDVVVPEAHPARDVRERDHPPRRGRELRDAVVLRLIAI